MNPIRSLAGKYLESNGIEEDKQPGGRRAEPIKLDALTALLLRVRRAALIDAAEEADAAGREAPENRVGAARALWRIKNLEQRGP